MDVGAPRVGVAGVGGSVDVIRSTAMGMRSARCEGAMLSSASSTRKFTRAGGGRLKKPLEKSWYRSGSM
jgi:hypothetical protein